MAKTGMKARKMGAPYEMPISVVITPDKPCRVSFAVKYILESTVFIS